MIRLVELGWRRDDSVFPYLCTSQFVPGRIAGADECLQPGQRQAAQRDLAARIIRAFAHCGASTNLLGQVSVSSSPIGEVRERPRLRARTPTKRSPVLAGVTPPGSV